MLLDANLLLYAVGENSSSHELAATWLDDTLNGGRRVGIPWQTIGAFVRIVTNPRVTVGALPSQDAWGVVESWLALPTVWIPPASERTAAILGRLIAHDRVTGNLVADAQLAALAIEHGLTVYSADTDFARFDGLSWINPLRASDGAPGTKGGARR